MNLNCEFSTVNGFYTCFVYSAAIPMPERNFYTLDGEHKATKCNEDVTRIYFVNVVKKFPRELGKIFPHLDTLWISKSPLNEISRHDLDGLENLTHLYLGYNRLTSLPTDLFVNMKKLQRISFNNNKIEFLSSEILKPLMNNNLKYFGLEENKNIDVCYHPNSLCGDGKVENSLEKFLALIDVKCRKPQENKELRNVKQNISGCTIQMTEKLSSTCKYQKSEIPSSLLKLKVRKMKTTKMY